MLDAKNIQKARQNLKIGQPVIMLIKKSTDEGSYKVGKVKGVVTGKYPHYFQVSYELRGNPVKTSYKYIELLREEPTIYKVRMKGKKAC